MTRANFLSADPQTNEEFQVKSVYESPYLKILRFRVVAGQSVFMYSDEMEGRVSLLVLRGNGEFVAEGVWRHSIEAGDIVVSEMSEANTLVAITDLSLMVTVTTSLATSRELGTSQSLVFSPVSRSSNGSGSRNADVCVHPK
ncbi:MAG: hypothetical protein AB9873_09785 [Syntrophobacteraceae bacterium]